MQNKYKSLRNTEKFVANRDYDRAIREYKRLLDTEGEDPAVLNTLGDLLLKNNRKEEAVENFRRVAEIYEESGFIAKAIAVCSKISNLDPADRTTLQKLVDLNKRRGNQFEAARYLGKLVEIIYGTGKLDEAISVQKQMLEIDPRNPKYNLQAARLLKEAGRTEESVDLYVSAGRVFLGKKKPADALECAKEAYQLDSDSKKVQELMADAERILEEEEGTHSTPNDIEEFQEPTDQDVSEVAEKPPAEPQEEISEVDFSDLNYGEINDVMEISSLSVPVKEKKAEPFDFSEDTEEDSSVEEESETDLDLEKIESAEIFQGTESPSEETIVEEDSKDQEESDQVEDIATYLGEFPPAPPASGEAEKDESKELQAVEEESEIEVETESVTGEEKSDGSESIVDSETAAPDDLRKDTAATSPQETKVDDIDLKNRLKEVDFFLRLDLKEDARRAIQSLQENYPDNREVLSRLDQLEEKKTEEESEEKQSEADFEIESALDDLFEGPTPDSDSVVGQTADSSAEGTVTDDPKNQFDLGVAYREMGMFEDAVTKFEEAYSGFEQMEDREECVRCAGLLAATQLQLGHFRDTIKWADKGLDSADIENFERKTLEYDRAQAFELLGEFDESLKSYRKVFEEDPDFRDVQARISKIELLSD